MKLSFTDIRETLDDYVPDEAFEIFSNFDVTPKDVAEAGCSIDIQVGYNSYLIKHSYDYKQELEQLAAEEWKYQQALIREFAPGVR